MSGEHDLIFKNSNMEKLVAGYVAWCNYLLSDLMFQVWSWYKAGQFVKKRIVENKVCVLNSAN